MADKRTQYKPEFKLRVALDAIRCKHKIADLVALYNINMSLIYRWRQILLEQGHEIFDRPQQKIGQADSADEKIQRLEFELKWLKTKVSLNEELIPSKVRRQLIDRRTHSISVSRQCELLGVSRSSVYYKSAPGTEKY